MLAFAHARYVPQQAHNSLLNFYLSYQKDKMHLGPDSLGPRLTWTGATTPIWRMMIDIFKLNINTDSYWYAKLTWGGMSF
jgi:hypothetical protein